MKKLTDYQLYQAVVKYDGAYVLCNWMALISLIHLVTVPVLIPISQKHNFLPYLAFAGALMVATFMGMWLTKKHQIALRSEVEKRMISLMSNRKPSKTYEIINTSIDESLVDDLLAIRITDDNLVVPFHSRGIDTDCCHIHFLHRPNNKSIWYEKADMMSLFKLIAVIAHSRINQIAVPLRPLIPFIFTNSKKRKTVEKQIAMYEMSQDKKSFSEIVIPGQMQSFLDIKSKDTTLATPTDRE